MGGATFLIGLTPTFEQVGSLAPVLLVAPDLLYGQRFSANGGSTKTESDKSDSKPGSKIPPSAQKDVVQGRSNPANGSAAKIPPSAQKDVAEGMSNPAKGSRRRGLGNIHGRGFVCKHKHPSCLRKSTIIQAAAVGPLKCPPSVSGKIIARIH
jgi:hypothetical protein